MKTPCAIPLFTVVCVLTVIAQAANTSLTNSHARRSLERSNRQHHRHAHSGPHRLSAEEAVVYQRGVIEDIANGLGLPPGGGPSSDSSTSTASSTNSASATDSASSASSTATDSASSSASASDSASSSASASRSESVSATDSASSSASATDSASSSPSVTDSASNTASASPSPTVTDPPASTSDSPTSTDSPASTATCDPLDLLCQLTQSPSSASPTSDTPASTPAPTSDTPASTPAPTSDSASPTVTDPPASTSDTPTSTDSPASSATCDPLDVICIGSTILAPSSSPTSDLPASTPAPTSDTPQTDSSSPTDSASQTASPTGTPVSTTDTPVSTSDAVTDIINTLSSLLPSKTDSGIVTQTDSSTPTQSDKPTDSVSQSDQATQTATQSDQATQTASQSDQATQTASRSDQATQTDTSSGTQTISQPPPTGTVTQTNSVSDSFIDTKTVTASDSPTDSATGSVTHTQSVSFPTLTESPTDSEPTASATDSIASASITDSAASVTLTTQPIPSEYSYITDSSLALTSVPATTTLSFSLLDPDAAFTTASLTQSGTAAPSQAAAFPTQLPTRIFPANRLDPNDPSLQGMTLVSLKFLNTLTWPFVVSSTNTAALLFVYTPQTIADALGITADQVLTFAMQAFAPADYNGDISQLSTVYLMYIPAEQVDALQQQLLTQNSPLYANQAGIPKQISQQLDATFPVNAVGLDTTIVGTGTSSNGSNSGSADASAASRRDAIIGVCAAFGVILVAVVFWWVYKSWRRRQDKAHRRLTHDSAGMHQAGGYGATTQSAYGTVYGAAPQRSGYAQPHTPVYTTTGAPIANPFEDASYEEDPDERRRSFFYAEDSLRGYTVPREEDQGITYTQVMRAQQGLAPNDGKRRAPIQASAISAPILRESSLNW